MYIILEVPLLPQKSNAVREFPTKAGYFDQRIGPYF